MPPDKDRVFVRGFGGEYGLKEERKRRLAAPRVIHTKDLPWGTGPNHWNRDILRPDMEPFRTQTLDIHMEAEAPGNVSHKHGHQNEALFYILEGRGHEIHDGKRYEWKAGDLVVVHNDSVHQHWNDDPERPTRALVIKAKPLWLFMGLMQQGYLERSSTEDRGFRPKD